MGAKFLNIELEVISRSDLSGLAKGLGNNFLPNFCGRPETHGDYLLSGNVFLEHWDYQENGIPDANQIALGLCDLVEKLGSSEILIWNGAKDRVFDIGLETNPNSEVGLEMLEPATMARIAKLGARLAVSVYAIKIEENKS